MLSSCIKEVEIDPFFWVPSGNSKKYAPCEIVNSNGMLPIWCNAENKDESTSRTGGPLLIYKDMLVRATKHKITMYDRNDGVILDTIAIDKLDSPYDQLFYQMGIVGKYLVLSYHDDKIVTFDLESRKKAAEKKFNSVYDNEHFAIIDNRLFVLTSKYTAAQILEMDPSNGETRLLLWVNSNNVIGLNPYVNYIVPHRTQSGENLLIFPIVTNRGQTNERIHVWAYDIDKGSYKWKSNNLNIDDLQRDELKCGTAHIAIAGSHLILLDKETGASVYEEELGFYCSKTNMLNSKLILYSDLSSMVCFDLKHEEILWKSDYNIDNYPLTEAHNYGNKGIKISPYSLQLWNPESRTKEHSSSMPFDMNHSADFSYVLDYYNNYAYTSDGKQIAAFDLDQIN